MPSAAGDTGEDAPAEVGRGGRRLAADEGEHDGEEHPHELRDEDHAEQRRPPREQAATEVPATPGDGREQAEDDRRRPGVTEPVQAERPLVAAASAAGGRLASAVSPEPASSAVGPSRTTTASAASS